MPHDGVEKKILCVHQSYELYGSDRIFLRTLKQIRHNFRSAHIAVHLPQEGALSDAIKEEGLCDEFIFDDLWVLRKANLRFSNIGRLPAAFRSIVTAHNRFKAYDHVFVNTIVVVDYIIASIFSRKSPVIHVHELLSGLMSILFSLLFAVARARVITNSTAVKEDLHDAWFKDVSLVENGTYDLSDKVSDDLTKKYEQRKSPRQLNLLLVGRISENKGQRVAIKALASLKDSYPDYNITLRIVGSVFEEQHHFLKDIKATIQKYDMSQYVELHNYNPNILEYYLWADVVLMPTQSKESFGLVAVEAMTLSKPVIASSLGGLEAIVVDHETGLKVTPGDVDELAEAMAYYLNNPEDRQRHGEAGYQRYKALYTIETYNENITQTLLNWWS